MCHFVKLNVPRRLNFDVLEVRKIQLRNWNKNAINPVNSPSNVRYALPLSKAVTSWSAQHATSVLFHPPVGQFVRWARYPCCSKVFFICRLLDEILIQRIGLAIIANHTWPFRACFLTHFSPDTCGLVIWQVRKRFCCSVKRQHQHNQFIYCLIRRLCKLMCIYIYVLFCLITQMSSSSFIKKGR